MKTKIGEFNGRPLVISSDEHEVKYPELLVTTDTSGDKISDIQQRNGDKLESILDVSKSEYPLPPGWNRAVRKTFQVTSYKTFVQQSDGNTYNVVGILADELIESIAYNADFYSDEAAIVNSEDTTVTVIGDLTMTYDYPIRIVFTPDYTGPWEIHTTVNKPLQISVTENQII